MSQLTEWTGVPRSSWYYKPTKGKRGIPPSTYTNKRDGTVVKNEVVVEEIKKVLGSGLDFYGYEKTTWELHDMDLTFREDAQRKRNGKAGNNFALIQKIALNLLKKEESKRMSLKNKRPVAAWDDKFLLKNLRI